MDPAQNPIHKKQATPSGQERGLKTGIRVLNTAVLIGLGGALLLSANAFGIRSQSLAITSLVILGFSTIANLASRVLCWFAAIGPEKKWFGYSIGTELSGYLVGLGAWMGMAGLAGSAFSALCGVIAVLLLLVALKRVASGNELPELADRCDNVFNFLIYATVLSGLAAAIAGFTQKPLGPQVNLVKAVFWGLSGVALLLSLVAYIKFLCLLERFVKDYCLATRP